MINTNYITTAQQTLDKLNSKLGLSLHEDTMQIDLTKLSNTLNIDRLKIQAIVKSKLQNYITTAKIRVRGDKRHPEYVSEWSSGNPYASSRNPDAKENNLTVKDNKEFWITSTKLPKEKIFTLLMLLPNSPKTVDIKMELGDLLNDLVNLLNNLTTKKFFIDSNMLIKTNDSKYIFDRNRINNWFDSIYSELELVNGTQKANFRNFVYKLFYNLSAGEIIIEYIKETKTLPDIISTDRVVFPTNHEPFVICDISYNFTAIKCIEKGLEDKLSKPISTALGLELAHIFNMNKTLEVKRRRVKNLLIELYKEHNINKRFYVLNPSYLATFIDLIRDKGYSETFFNNIRTSKEVLDLKEIFD